MRISRARRVEADRVLACLQRGDLVRLDEYDVPTRIDEPADQPGRRRAIDVNPLARHPLHFLMCIRSSAERSAVASTSSMWLCNAVTTIPPARNARITG